MEIKKFVVATQIDAFDEHCQYKVQLLYKTTGGETYKQYSETVTAAKQEKFLFKIPLEHVARTGCFTCVLHIELLTPMPPGPDREAALAAGLEEPCMPVLIHGSHLEITG